MMSERFPLGDKNTVASIGHCDKCINLVHDQCAKGRDVSFTAPVICKDYASELPIQILAKRFKEKENE